MTDPKRWSDDVDLTDSLEQQLVRSAQACQMPSADKQVAWNRLVGALPPTLVEPSLGAPNTGSAAGSWLAISSGKALWLALGISGLAAAGYPLVHRAYVQRPPATHSSNAAPLSPSPATPLLDLTSAAATSAAVSATAPISGVVTAASTLNKTDVHPATSAVNATAATLPAMPVSQLSEENRALLQARQALRSNDPGGALGLLEQSQKRFPRGALAEEREALTIEALARLGATARAAARAQAFLKNYPRSPHAADIRRYVTR